jgi:hypothetical protein
MLKLSQNLQNSREVKPAFVSDMLIDTNLIEILRERLSSLSSRVYKNVGKDSPAYANDFNLLINKPWIDESSEGQKHLMYTSFALENKPRDLITSYDEPFGDSCYALLLKKGGFSNENCSTSDKCFEFFTEPKATSEFLSNL